jgi:endonuclease/exonuclease/phosphatase (EEP) superfamily protein YafD
MGFVLPRPVQRPAGPTLRVLSYNTLHAADGAEGLRSLILANQADVVLFQWTSGAAREAMDGPGFEGWTLRRVGQFTVASRFPIVSIDAVGIPPDSPPAAHAVLDTPLGLVDVYNVRPKSARDEIGAAHGLGIRERLWELDRDARTGRLGEMASFREAQIRSILEETGKAHHLVLIAGDTNLPGGSLFSHRYFGTFQDAFAQAGLGFGFTHPAKLPWMRLDRVLLGPGLQAISFRVLPRGASSHRAVLAEIVRSQ